MFELEYTVELEQHTVALEPVQQMLERERLQAELDSTLSASVWPLVVFELH